MRPRLSSPLIVVVLLVCLTGCGTRAAGAPSSRGVPALVRVDQVGYGSDQPKSARVMSPISASRAPFRVLDASGATVMSGRASADLGRWSAAFPHIYRIDLSQVRTPGRYVVELTGRLRARSPTFGVDAPSRLYGPIVADVLRFLRGQRDGPDVDQTILSRRPSHLADRAALTYATPVYRGTQLRGALRSVGGPVDVSGGWMDAGDTLKFAGTASFTEVMLLTALERYPAAFANQLASAHAEARHGLQWLLKLWDARHARLVYQVGLGNGNGRSILGAHDTPWRLPESDDRLKVGPRSPQRFVKYRPAFVMGPSISPNLAGRMAAALALGAKLFASSDRTFAIRSLDAARSLYAHARTHKVGPLVVSTPRLFYPEAEWRDDMELGAVAISDAAHALGGADAPAYLRTAARWADDYGSSPLNGGDTLNLYDVGPVAHDRLARALAERGTASGLVSRASLASDLTDQITLARSRARRDPFGLAWSYGDDDVVSHALGMSIEAGILDELRNSRAQAALASAQRDLVLGANAWGSSFIVGSGSLYPHCLHDPVANLNGSLGGSGAIMRGAVLPGPVRARELEGLTASRGARTCPRGRADRFKRFSGMNARYADRVAASPTVEPSIDLAGLALLAFARQAEG